MPITERTRRNIIQLFKSESIKWAGTMNEVDFLSRLYDLDALPSTDPRYNTAKWDIQTHTISFPGDWSDAWIFGDPRFDLHNCSDGEFLRFMAETIDPVVRPDRDQSTKMLEEFNRHLGEDGYQIVEMKTKFGNLRYVGKGITPNTSDTLSTTGEGHHPGVGLC